ncbi:cupin domain-containing protein [Paenibacillus cisolokensis]|uniref:cupin domain-containing protein n=1 Tax=Paenibacillus cisolokensis TaxID=1658519 RepID=UPI003D2A0332
MTRHRYDLRSQASSLRGRGYAHLSSGQLPHMESICVSEVHLEPGGHLPPHSHPDAGELCYLLSGEISYALADPSAQNPHIYLMQPGQAAYAPPGWYHWLTPLTPSTKLLLIYNQDRPHQQELLPWRSEIYPVMEQAANQAANQTTQLKSGQNAASPSPPWLASQRKTTINR